VVSVGETLGVPDDVGALTVVGTSFADTVAPEIRAAPLSRAIALGSDTADSLDTALALRQWLDDAEALVRAYLDQLAEQFASRAPVMPQAGADDDDSDR